MTKILPAEKHNQKTYSVCTIGNFDGVHTGHRKILDIVKKEAEREYLKSVVITFDPHPRKVLYPESFVCSIVNMETKIYLLQQEGIDQVVVINFTEDFYKKTQQEFMDFLKFNIGCKKLVIGVDWRFGYNKEGNLEFAKSYGQKIGIQVVPLEDIKLNGERISSSRIRKFLMEADLAGTKMMLGRDFMLRGRVVAGNQIGRQIGFPTINLKPVEGLCLKKGVYAGFVQIKNEKLPAVINYGYRPTVDGKILMMEAHVIQEGVPVMVEEGDYVNIYFIKYIRQEVKFSSLQELKTQISNDILKAKEVLSDVKNHT